MPALLILAIPKAIANSLTGTFSNAFATGDTFPIAYLFAVQEAGSDALITANTLFLIYLNRIDGNFAKQAIPSP